MYNSNADWVLAGPDMQGSIYTLVNGKYILQKSKVHIVEGSRIGPPTSH